MSAPGVHVRFDAFGGGAWEGRCFRFSGLRSVVQARRLDEVLPALGEVEAAAARGLHATGWLTYEAAPAFDAALAVHAPDPRLPLLWFALWEVRDRAELPARPTLGSAELGPWEAALPDAEYRGRVERIRGWIAAGDTYQANLTFPLRAAFSGSPEVLYERLARAQRSPFCALIETPEWAVVSASPELFFRWRGSELTLRPMKGTRPRGRWGAEDRRLAAELRASPKERAENLMIVDLLRNDAGRVAEWGSVRVSRLFATERYPTVHQMTSTVHARTRPGTGLPELFRALFPCGSVTGAPKVRTTRILRAVEDGPRGVYTGAIGWVSPGEAVFSVAIRTVVVDRRRGEATLGVGSGITWDSDAAEEHRECLSKAAFTRAPAADFELLESLAWAGPDGFLRLGGHLRRLRASAARWGFPYDREALRGALKRAAAPLGEGRWKVRLRLGADGSVATDATPLPPDFDAPLRVAISRDPVDSADPLLFHKTTDRAVYTSRAAAHPGCDEIVLTNERGEVTEACTGNLVARIDGSLWTPPLDSGLLPGVLRAELLRAGKIRERTLRPEDLQDADEVWIVNSVRGWRRALLLTEPRAEPQ
ncbi:MAG: aminodeoxychorismate synthase component I [Gemmatimonadota bacterium]|nr:aminodeoxychorismate synthase component I [Gemmatimonadota bacterium]